MKTYCCESMKTQIEFKCDIHKDSFDCPDSLIYYSKKDKSYGLIIPDGGSSSISINYCPWCGKKL